MAVNVLKVTLASDLDGKNTSAEIYKNVCALLNSNGGKLVLTASDAFAQSSAGNHIRKIEQSFQNVLNIFTLRDNFKTAEQGRNHITVDVKGSELLCMFNSNLYITTDNQVLKISAYDHENIKKVLTGSRIIELEDSTASEISAEFVFGCHSSLRESKTVQLKNLKAEGKGSKLFQRMMSNKLTLYISGFANGLGGRIYYGIDDDGVVQGEKLEPGEEAKIIDKVSSEVDKMIWPDHYTDTSKPWSIKFVPVVDSSNNKLPSIFVIIISVSAFPGGVFVKEPESYHIVNGEVKKMDFNTWKGRMLAKDKEKLGVPLVLSRGRWSSKSRETLYMQLTQHLEKLRQLGEWSRIKNLVVKLSNDHDNSTVNSQLVSIFQLTAVAYRQRNFDEARVHLKEFRSKLPSAEDPLIFEVEGCYSAAAIERSSGNYVESWAIIQDGLQKIGQAPAGLVTAAFYLNAGYVLSILANDESFIGEKKHEDYPNLRQRHVDQAKEYCYKALQHLRCVEGYEIAKQELNQRISITLSFLYLGSSISCGPFEDENTAPVSRDDLKLVAEKVTDSEKSLLTLSGTERLAYNSCRLQLVRADMYFRQSQLSSGFDAKVPHLESSLVSTKDALKIANKKNFQDIKGFCESRIKRLQEILVQVKATVNDENERQSTEDAEFLHELRQHSMNQLESVESEQVHIE